MGRKGNVPYLVNEETLLGGGRHLGILSMSRTSKMCEDVSMEAGLYLLTVIAHLLIPMHFLR